MLNGTAGGRYAKACEFDLEGIVAKWKTAGDHLLLRRAQIHRATGVCPITENRKGHLKQEEENMTKKPSKSGRKLLSQAVVASCCRKLFSIACEEINKVQETTVGKT